MSICGLGGKKKDGAPATFNLTPGLICQLFGVQNPLCRVLDAFIPSLPNPLDKVKALGRGVKELKYLSKVRDLLLLLPDEDIDTEAFCSVYPDYEIEDISWFDLFLAFSSVSKDEFFRKVTQYVAKERWFEYCECRLPDYSRPDPAPFDPVPSPPFVPPELPCWSQSYTDQINAELGNNNAAIAFYGSRPECLPWVLNEPPGGLTAPPVLTEAGIPHPTWNPNPYNGILDEDGCRCYWRIVASNRFIASGCFNGVTSEGLVQSGLQVQIFRWCGVVEEPEFEPPILFDPDWLEDLCEVFTDLPECAECPPPVECRAESVSVSEIDTCEAPVAGVWMLEICGEDGGDDNRYGCLDPLALNFDPLATEDGGNCIYGDVLGCTDPSALNYNPLATQDDGSCIYEEPILGCTDGAALNYNPQATQDDGSCIYEEPQP